MSEKYDLNFEEALLSMIKDWEICESEYGSKYRFNHARSCFEMLTSSEGNEWWINIYYTQQRGKWRVVK